MSWFDDLSEDRKKRYLKEHPGSKFDGSPEDFEG